LFSIFIEWISIYPSERFRYKYNDKWIRNSKVLFIYFKKLIPHFYSDNVLGSSVILPIYYYCSRQRNNCVWWESFCMYYVGRRTWHIRHALLITKTSTLNFIAYNNIDNVHVRSIWLIKIIIYTMMFNFFCSSL